MSEVRRGNEHIPMSFQELAVLLKDMARHVEEGDSFEGSVEYLMPGPMNGPEKADVMVRAVYRYNNLIGQGGVRIIGTQGGRP